MCDGYHMKMEVLAVIIQWKWATLGDRTGSYFGHIPSIAKSDYRTVSVPR